MATFANKARLAARGSTGKQVTIPKDHHSAPLAKHAEEHVSTTYHPPVLARAHAHQSIQSQKDGPNTATYIEEKPTAADPHAPKKFVGQGAYRARMFLHHGVS
ncbi:hypothetical protein K503DRAFT_802978 [Rhizopogon vinicolor AM-OR11-026]|uniref:Uncharacterized protein n=1 Tax=Rhizopogon vinicolor AM-OR11-026 TaxID=1314800 RepID=A0A1B7MRN8_9AGAM|nr:hypothetical protein K503DRAFT_802978 [Rhizopogon vinicolor AM-OR11-026]